MQRARELWTVGQSQPNSCDPLFERWITTGGLTEQIAWERIQLALLHRQDALAKHLTRYVPSQQALAERFVATASNPQLLSNVSQYQPGSNQSSEQITDIVTVALRRLGRDNAEAALALWPAYQNLPFSQEQRLALTRDIGVRLAKRNKAEALAFMMANDPRMQDDSVAEWSARLALRTGHWHTAQELIRNMPEHLRQQNRWRYWQARSLQLAQPNSQQPLLLYQPLARERDFYGFMAADRSEQPYHLQHQALKLQPKTIQKVRNAAGLQRALEFDARQEVTESRREWYHLSESLSRDELVAQARIAYDMGWYFPAIRTITKAKYWDDLDIRFPMAHQQNFVTESKNRGIHSSWAFAVTRQESAFMIQAESHVGAMGLMQLMPATAKETAQRYGIPLANPRSAVNPSTNIQLGTAYLSQVLEQFKGNRVLASAAYNAGPGRVRQWLRDAKHLPYDVWVESIPFDETRLYVQNVLTYSVIYGEKLKAPMPLVEWHERFLDQQ